MEKLAVERCIRPSGFGTVTSRQLHVFSDASSYAYAAAAYLLLTDCHGRIHCSFMMGKARLAPIKAMTIPLLELTAATVAIRVGNLLSKELSDPVDAIYHINSTIVLCYIANEQQRFHVFVANRVQLIRDHSNVEQWRYVDSSSNLADDASRGLSGGALLECERWLKGPEFLWKNEEEWPKSLAAFGNVPDEDPEVREVQIPKTERSLKTCLHCTIPFASQMLKRPNLLLSGTHRPRRLLGR